MVFSLGCCSVPAWVVLPSLLLLLVWCVAFGLPSFRSVLRSGFLASPPSQKKRSSYLNHLIQFRDRVQKHITDKERDSSATRKGRREALPRKRRKGEQHNRNGVRRSPSLGSGAAGPVSLVDGAVVPLILWNVCSFASSSFCVVVFFVRLR